MTPLRAFAVVAGLVLLVATAFAWSEVSALPNLSAADKAWLIASLWPRALSRLAENLVQEPGLLLGYRLWTWPLLGLHLSAPVVAFRLAERRRRSQWGWAVACVVFPYASAALAALPAQEIRTDTRSVAVGPMRTLFSRMALPGSRIATPRRFVLAAILLWGAFLIVVALPCGVKGGVPIERFLTMESSLDVLRNVLFWLCLATLFPVVFRVEDWLTRQEDREARLHGVVVNPVSRLGSCQLGALLLAYLVYIVGWSPWTVPCKAIPVLILIPATLLVWPALRSHMRKSK